VTPRALGRRVAVEVIFRHAVGIHSHHEFGDQATADGEVSAGESRGAAMRHAWPRSMSTRSRCDPVSAPAADG
jgi:hypothetical protein